MKHAIENGNEEITYCYETILFFIKLFDSNNIFCINSAVTLTLKEVI